MKDDKKDSKLQDNSRRSFVKKVGAGTAGILAAGTAPYAYSATNPIKWRLQTYSEPPSLRLHSSWNLAVWAAWHTRYFVATAAEGAELRDVLPQCVDEFLRLCEIGDGCGLRHFEAQRRRRDARLANFVFDEFENVIIGQRLSGQVDRKYGAELLDNRRGVGTWGATQATALALSALTTHAERSRHPRTGGRLAVEIDESGGVWIEGPADYVFTGSI